MYIHEQHKSIDTAEEIVGALNSHFKAYLLRYPDTPNSYASHFDPINSLLAPETEKPRTCQIDCSNCSAKLNEKIVKDLNELKNLTNSSTNRESLKQILAKHHHPDVIINTSFQFQQAKEHLIAHIGYAHSSRKILIII
jgi:hypothetical protein